MFNMKRYLLVAAFIVAIAKVKSDHKEEMHKVILACGEELHVNPDDVKAVYKEHKGEPKEELKCHIKCVMEKLGQWKNGAFDPDSAIKQAQKIPDLKDRVAEISKSVNECKNKKGANECDTAFLISKCIYDQHQATM